MTFTELKTVVKRRCGLTSADADERVGEAINQRYRRVTSELGLDATRFVTRSVSCTIGVQTVIFTSLEKIDRVLDVTSGTTLLEEVSIHDIRSVAAAAGAPSQWALQNTASTSVTIRLDTSPQVAYDLQADGWTSLDELVGDDEPAFPASFHTILSDFVISDELLQKEKEKLAAIYAQKAEDGLAKLRFHLADSHTKDVRQGDSATTFGTGSGGGSGTTGGTSYTQTGLITFDRDPSAPFAVTASSAKVDNLDADKLDGQTGADYHDASLLTGLAPASTIATNAVTYARMQDITAASRLLGRGSAGGAGDPEQISLGTGLSMSTTTLSVTPAGDDAQYILAMRVYE